MFDVFKGRTGLARYWRLTGICILAIIAGLYAVVTNVNETSRAPANVPATVVSIAGALIFITACVALFIVGIWRLRDRGKSGFWIALYYPVPPILALLAAGPESQIPVLSWVAVALLGWTIIDLGILEAADQVAA